MHLSNDMPRVSELIYDVRSKYPADNFFKNVEETLRLETLAFEQYKILEKAFAILDSESWKALKIKAIKHFKDHRTGQLKQGFFNQLYDAIAYQYLIEKGYANIRILAENGSLLPDIEYLDGTEKCFCEVKTIGISDEEIKRACEEEVYSSHIYHKLSDGFFEKLHTQVKKAIIQIQANGNRGLIYLIVHFDDFTGANDQQYQDQIGNYFDKLNLKNIDVYLRFKLFGQKYIYRKFS